MDDGLIIKFGDVFRRNEQEYVFLAQSDVVYAALILDNAMTSRVSKLSSQREVRSPNFIKHPAFAIVILETEEFRDRGAHFAKTDHGDVNRFDIIGSVNDNDRKNIKEEILLVGSAVPLKLKEIIKELKK